jgi:hypothetical protein
MRTQYVKNWLSSLLVVGVLVSCTVAPTAIKDPTASYDEGIMNSGFLGFTNGMARITPYARARYNGLIDKYGNQFVPPLTNDVGVSVSPSGLVVLIDKQHLVDFATMNRWQKSNRPAVP